MSVVYWGITQKKEYNTLCVLYEMKWFQIRAFSKTHGLLCLLAFFNTLLHLYCRLEFLLEEMVGALETVAAAATWSTDSGRVCFCPSTKPTG